MELNEIISKNLIELRKKNKLTQLELAEKLDFSNKSISKWESGEAIPNIEILMKLAKLYDVNLDYFVNEIHQEDSSKAVELVNDKKENIWHIYEVDEWATRNDLTVNYNLYSLELKIKIILLMFH